MTDVENHKLKSFLEILVDLKIYSPDQEIIKNILNRIELRKKQLYDKFLNLAEEARKRKIKKKKKKARFQAYS